MRKKVRSIFIIIILLLSVFPASFIFNAEEVSADNCQNACYGQPNGCSDVCTGAGTEYCECMLSRDGICKPAGYCENQAPMKKCVEDSECRSRCLISGSKACTGGLLCYNGACRQLDAKGQFQIATTRDVYEQGESFQLTGATRNSIPLPGGSVEEDEFYNNQITGDSVFDEFASESAEEIESQNQENEFYNIEETENTEMNNEENPFGQFQEENQEIVEPTQNTNPVYDLRLLDSDAFEENYEDEESFGAIAWFNEMPTLILKSKLEKGTLSEYEKESALQSYEEVSNNQIGQQIIGNSITGSNIFDQLFGGSNSDSQLESSTELSLSKNEFNSLLNNQGSLTENQIEKAVEVQEEIIEAKHGEVREIIKDELRGDVGEAFNFISISQVGSCYDLENQMLVGDCSRNKKMYPTLFETNEFTTAIDVWKKSFINSETQRIEKVTGEGVTIAVIDDGIDFTHPDLKDNVLEVGSCFCNDGVVPCCINWNTLVSPWEKLAFKSYEIKDREMAGFGSPGGHATQTISTIVGTGTIAEEFGEERLGDSKKYLQGVAPDAKIYSIVSRAGYNIGLEDDDLKALNYLVSEKEDIEIVLQGHGSLCSSENWRGIEEYERVLEENEKLVFSIGAGNDGYPETIMYPSCVPSIFAIGAYHLGEIFKSVSGGKTFEVLGIQKCVGNEEIRCGQANSKETCEKMWVYCDWDEDNAECVHDPYWQNTIPPIYCRDAITYKSEPCENYLTDFGNCHGDETVFNSFWWAGSSTGSLDPSNVQFDKPDFIEPSGVIVSVPVFGREGLDYTYHSGYPEYYPNEQDWMKYYHSTETYGGTLTYNIGTSFSAPYFAGIVALMKQIDPSLTRDEIYDSLIQHEIIKPLINPETGFEYGSEYQGWGTINIEKLIDLLLQQGGMHSSAQHSYLGWEIIPIRKNQCNDGLDNDGDGLIDLRDSGCANAWDTDEFEGDHCGKDGCQTELGENKDNCCMDCGVREGKGCGGMYYDVLVGGTWKYPEERFRSYNYPEEISSTLAKLNSEGIISGTTNIKGTARVENGGDAYYRLFISENENGPWERSLGEYKKTIMGRGVMNLGLCPINEHNLLSNWDSSEWPDGNYFLKLGVFKDWTELAIDKSEIRIDNDKLLNPSLEKSKVAYISDLLEIKGSMIGDRTFDSFKLSWGQGENPEQINYWSQEGIQLENVEFCKGCTLATFDTSVVNDLGTYIIKLEVNRNSLKNNEYTNVEYGKIYLKNPVKLTNPDSYQSQRGHIQEISSGDHLNIQGFVVPPNFERFEIKYKRQGSSNWLDDGITLMGSGRQKIGNPESSRLLGKWDTLGVEEGIYDIKLIAYYGSGKTVEDEGKIKVKFTPSVLANTGNSEIKGYLKCDLYGSGNGGYPFIENLYSDVQERVVESNNFLAISEVVNSHLLDKQLSLGRYMIKCYLAPTSTSKQSVVVENERGYVVPLEDFDFFEIVRQKTQGGQIGGSAIQDVSFAAGAFYREIWEFFKRIL